MKQLEIPFATTAHNSVYVYKRIVITNVDVFVSVQETESIVRVYLTRLHTTHNHTICFSPAVFLMVAKTE